MSRIGKLPVAIPDEVDVTVESERVRVRGPAGTLEQPYEPKYVSIEVEDGTVQVLRKGETKAHRARHGLYRSLVANMVRGVKEPFERRLQLVGLGYRADLQAQGEEQVLVLEIGYSHPVRYPVAEGVQVEVNEVRSRGVEAEIVLSSPNKQLVGQVASEIRRLRKPEPYKGTGIRYHDEEIIRKEGKLAGAGGEG